MRKVLAGITPALSFPSLRVAETSLRPDFRSLSARGHRATLLARASDFASISNRVKSVVRFDESQ